MAKTFTITIKKTGKDPRQWMQEVKTRIYPKLQKEIILSAEATATIMKRILEGSGYNLKKLSDTINVDEISTTGGVHIGIGRIDSFPVGQQSGASYWEAFDEGFLVSQANIGYFGDNFRAPESGGYGEKWHHTGKGSGFFLMQPNKVIEPLNYSGIGYEELKNHIIKEIAKFNKELIQAGK